MVGCHEFTRHGICAACEPGYYLQDKCILCPDGCEECNSDFDCTICSPGFTQKLT